MTSQETLDDIKSLMLEFAGITSAVAFRSNEGDSVWIRFRCCDFDSLRTITSIAEASNVSISIGEAHGRRCGEEKTDPNLPFDMTISEVHGENPLTTTEIFGIFLARTRRKQGLQNTAAAHRLQVERDGLYMQ